MKKQKPSEELLGRKNHGWPDLHVLRGRRCSHTQGVAGKERSTSCPRLPLSWPGDTLLCPIAMLEARPQHHVAIN